MTTTAIAPAQPAKSIEQVLIEGDLSRLDAAQKIAYYMKVCESLGLNPYTKPFDYLRLNGKEILYARKDAADQLRKLQHVSIVGLQRERLDDLYVVTATARTVDGRSDSSIGAVMVKGLNGEALANALMKAETKAKRRVTLSICGLGMTDDSEVDSIPGAQRTDFNGPVYTPDELGADVDDDGRMVEVRQVAGVAPIRERDVDDKQADVWTQCAVCQTPQQCYNDGEAFVCRDNQACIERTTEEPAAAPKRKAPTRDELTDRYAELVNEATGRGIPLDADKWAIGQDDSIESIAEKGKRLKYLIYGDQKPKVAA